MKILKTIRVLLTTIISIGVVAVVLMWMSGAFEKKIPPGKVAVESPRAGKLATDKVHAIIETESTDVVGTLRAQRRTDVSAKIMATIADILVNAGDKVKKGQSLVVLDARDLQAKAAQAKKAVDAAQAAANQTAADVARYKNLLAEKVIPRQTFDEYDSRNKVAQAQLQQAQEALRETEVALSYARIESPTDGVVVEKHADKGDTATPGKPLLTIYDPSVLRLEAPVHETLATQIHVGDLLPVRIDSLNLDVEGRVDEIVPQAEAASRSVLVKIALPKEPKMVEGMFGRVKIPTGERRRYCIPQSAVLRVGQLTYADVVTTGGEIERRPLTLGEHSEYGRVEALSGVEPGDEVVLHGSPPPPMPAALPGGRRVAVEGRQP